MRSVASLAPRRRGVGGEGSLFPLAPNPSPEGRGESKTVNTSKLARHTPPVRANKTRSSDTTQSAACRIRQAADPFAGCLCRFVGLQRLLCYLGRSRAHGVAMCRPGLTARSLEVVLESRAWFLAQRRRVGPRNHAPGAAHEGERPHRHAFETDPSHTGITGLTKSAIDNQQEQPSARLTCPGAALSIPA